MKKKMQISAQERNKQIARQNREFFKRHGLFTINIIGSPGCGKTLILEYMAAHFDGKFAVIVGDVKTAVGVNAIFGMQLVGQLCVELQQRRNVLHGTVFENLDLVDIVRS